jgi:hypothetical protein
MAVLVALVGLVVPVVMVLLLEVSFGRRSGGNANNGKAAEQHCESNQRLHSSSPRL